MRRRLRGLRLLAVVTACAVVGLTAACGSDGGTDSSGGTTTVTIGTLRGQPHFYAPYLYKDHTKGDLEFKVVALDTAPALNDALVSGRIDFAIGSITATIAGDATGRDIRIVAGAADGGSGLIGDDKVKTIHDLPGKKVGYIASSAQLVALRLTLAKAGVDIDDLDLVSLTAPEFFNAFKTGQIDAFAGPEVGVSLALANGGHDLGSLYDTEIGRLNLGLLTSQKTIDEDPELVRDVVATHAATTDYMAGSVQDWLPPMAQQYGADQATLEHAMKNFWLRADLSPTYQQQIDSLTGQMVRLGLIKKAPQGKVYDAEFASHQEPAA